MSRRRVARNQVTFRTIGPGQDVPTTARATNGAVLRFTSARLHPVDRGSIVATYRS